MVSSGSCRAGRIAADHEHEAVALHADQHVGVHVPRGAAHMVDVELLRSGADEHRDLAVAVPAECGDTARQLVVVLAGEDRVHHERLEARVPQPARLGGPCVDVGGGEGDLARVEQDRLAQRLAAVLHAVLDDLDRDADELQRLLQAHRAEQLTRCRAEDVGGDPGRRSGVVEPGDERRDAGLGDEAHGRAPARGHVAVPRQRVLEALQRLRSTSSPAMVRNHASVSAFVLGFVATLSPASSRRRPIRWCRRSRRAAGTSRSPGRGASGRPRRGRRAARACAPRPTDRRS